MDVRSNPRWSTASTMTSQPQHHVHLTMTKNCQCITSGRRTSNKKNEFDSPVKPGDSLSLRSKGFYILTMLTSCYKVLPLGHDERLISTGPGTPTLAEEPLFYTFVRGSFTTSVSTRSVPPHMYSHAFAKSLAFHWYVIPLVNFLAIQLYHAISGTWLLLKDSEIAALRCPFYKIRMSAHPMAVFSGFYESHGLTPSGDARSIVPAHRNGHQNGQQSGHI